MQEKRKIYRFVILGRLPGTNEITNSWGSGWQAGYGLKKKTKRLIGMYIIAARIPIITHPIVVRIRYFERDNRRDIDNVHSGAKFILDALKTMRRITNDSQRYVRNVIPEVFVDKINPRVEVTLTEVL